MDNKTFTTTTTHEFENKQQPSVPNKYDPNLDIKTIAIHLGLFLVTIGTVSLAGAAFVGFSPSLFPLGLPELSDFYRGLLFAGLLLGFLGVHEFGHYFASLYHRVKVTLPYFIPIPLGIGTLGAVIRIKQKVNDTIKLFDIGISGPLAGFVVSMTILLYGFCTLPDASYIQNFEGHQAIKQYVAQNGEYPDTPQVETNGTLLTVGHTILYDSMASLFENVPPMWEMYHYPFLFAGWLGLFFTALNLMPIGQLDGGHILYSLIGFRKHRIVARLFFALLVTFSGIQALPFIHLSLGDWDIGYGLVSWAIWGGLLLFLLNKSYHGDRKWVIPVFVGSLAVTAAYLFVVVGNVTTSGSLIWVVWSFFIAFMVKVEHPPAIYERELDFTRKTLGWLSMVIFVLCISPNPLYVM